MKSVSARSVSGVILCALVFFFEAPQGWGSNSLYLQTNLVSDIPGLAQSTDPNLKNPWGVSFSTVSPFWVSNAASNTTTLYSGTGSRVVPLVAGIPGGPTGQVQNPTTGFLLSNGKPANFIFDVMAGSIYAWNSDSGPTAQLVATVPYMSFTGLALANNGSDYFLYAANGAGTGSIEVFDSTFTHTTLSGAFKDPSIPAGYVPYNVQAISGQLYVEYANFQQNKGAVSIFDMNGTFIKELIAAGGPQLNLPWGVVIAPAGFGGFAADLLVGNFGDGKINAFDPSTGAFLGTLSSFNGPIVNSGLWSLSVRTGGTFNQDAVYFTAGINNQVDGLFGVLTAVTPSTVGITTPGSLPAAQIGTAYAHTLQATGGAAPYSNWTVTAGSLPPGMSLNSSTGTLGGTPVAIGSTFNFMVTVTDRIGATGSASFQLTIQPPVPTPLARVGGFAQVASGGGWKTTMTLINASAATINAQINLYSDAGTPLALSLTFPQFSSSTFGSSVNVILAPNDSIIIASNSPRSSLGWADVLASGPLSGYTTFGLSSGGNLLSEGTASLDTRLSNSLLLPYDNTNGDQTGLAVANQGSSAQTLTVTLLDQNGIQLASSKINLPAFAHSSFFIGNQFPQSANQLGIIQVQSSAIVTGVGLRFSPTGSFTSVPIIH